MARFLFCGGCFVVGGCFAVWFEAMPAHGFLVMLTIASAAYIGYVFGVIFEGRRYERMISEELERSRNTTLRFK